MVAPDGFMNTMFRNYMLKFVTFSDSPISVNAQIARLNTELSGKARRLTLVSAHSGEFFNLGLALLCKKKMIITNVVNALI